MTRALLALCACAAGLCMTLSQISAEPSDKEKLELANQVYALLKDKCYSCHGEAGKKAMGKVDGDAFNWVLDYDKLVATRLLAANDETSELYTSMKSGSMPRDPSNTRKRMKLPQEDIDMVLKWIKAGAPKWDPDAKSLPAPKVAWTELKTKGPAARADSAMCEGPNGTVVLFGGNQSDAIFGDTWVFASGAWTEQKPATSPDSRFFSTMAFDRKRNVNVMVSVDAKTWEWDGKVWKQAAPEASPPQRESFALAYDASKGVTVLYGGVSKDGKLLSDTWSYDGKTWKAQEVKGPEARKNAAMGYSPASKALLLFGGETDKGAQSETWLFDGNSWKLQTPSTTPTGSGRIAASINSLVLVTGGDALNTWLWNGKDWSQAGSGPAKRSGFALAFNPKSKGIVLFGGKAESHLDDTWELNAAK
ncbi:MAG: hypothetical protein KBG84_13225 [Planctomycetes bacterium]|nr:hypothetical protein [Planctomycetota bacterium]